MKRPNIFDYADYREYLRDWYSFMKESNAAFSFRAFSKWAGFRSPNQLQLIINGRRNITESTLPIFVKIMKLKRREKRYFEILVNFNQTMVPEIKARYFEELKSFLKVYGESIRGGQYEYLSKWYYPVIRELVAVSGFKEDAAWIAKRIGHGMTPKMVREAIAKLEEIGLLKRDGKGRLTQAESVISTGPDSAEASVYLYHEQMIKLAYDALRKQPPDEREFAGMTFACRKKDMPEISQLIRDFRKQVIDYLEERSEKCEDEDVYQLDLQLFRLTSRGGRS